jgi:hypothetical protein
VKGTLPLLLAALTLALPAPAFAHGVFEASELELHVLSDEGTDSIEPYGGYDINELFVGFAHDPAIGAGPAGDGVYLRAEVYGLPENGAPVPGQTWSLRFTFETPGGALERTISTTDAKTFTSDFDSLLAEVDAAERATHFQRAFISYEAAGLKPGDSIGSFKVESRVNGDLRDVAPGGIPVPGSNGAATFPDPLAIPGKGALAESVQLVGPEQYVKVALQPLPDGSFNVTLRSALTKGGQHVFVQPGATEGWTYRLDGATSAPLAANGTLAFRLTATPANATAPLRLDLLTDVGGRAELFLGTDGILRGPKGAVAFPAPPAAVKSPAAGAALALVLLVGAAARRRGAA